MMTDEERAHAVVFWIPGLDDDWRNSLLRRVAADFSEIRADEREKCAISCEVHAASVIDAGSGTPWSAAHECAAAIRKGGET